jgi:beta-mannanase
MTAADYAAMFRHVVHRLRLDGASRFVSVMNYMGYVPWAQQPWFAQLWPGDDAVDWVGIDPYASGDSTGYMSGDFNTLVNRRGTDFPGYYRWITSAHSGFPIIVAEWGVSESASNPTGKARFFQSVAAEIASYPAIRALVYFDTPAPPQHNIGDTRPDSSAISLEAWRALGMGSAFIGPEVRYGLGSLAPSG